MVQEYYEALKFEHDVFSSIFEKYTYYFIRIGRLNKVIRYGTMLIDHGDHGRCDVIKIDQTISGHWFT